MIELREKKIREIAFACYRNVNLRNAGELIARGAGPDNFFEDAAESLASRTGLQPRFFDDTQRRAILEKARKELEFIEQNGIRAVFCTDPAYPTRLAACDDAPAMIFVIGNADLNPDYSIAIVGTRHATHYGLDFTRNLVRELTESLPGSLQIISGLAYGIDICAHSESLACSTPTGAILAHGLNTIYPADHRPQAMQIVRSGGFLMTEYPSWTRTHRGNFLARNRIVAAMSDAVVVIESDMRGGAMSTARIASAYSREVFALPGRITDLYSRGCLDLLARQIALPVRDARDIADAMGWKSSSVDKESSRQLLLQLELSSDKERLLRAILENPDLSVNELCIRLALSYSQITSLIFELEMDNLLLSLPGTRYALTPDAVEYLSSKKK